MAKTKVNSNNFAPKPRRKRPGVHSKCKSSGLKQSKNYKKVYKGQG